MPTVIGLGGGAVVGRMVGAGCDGDVVGVAGIVAGVVGPDVAAGTTVAGAVVGRVADGAMLATGDVLATTTAGWVEGLVVGPAVGLLAGLVAVASGDAWAAGELEGFPVPAWAARVPGGRRRAEDTA
jgi:hypothetical protein